MAAGFLECFLEDVQLGALAGTGVDPQPGQEKYTSQTYL